MLKCLSFCIQIKLLYPDSGSVYSYNLDDAGISSSESDDAVDEDEDKKKKEVELVPQGLVVQN